MSELTIDEIAKEFNLPEYVVTGYKQRLTERELSTEEQIEHIMNWYLTLLGESELESLSFTVDPGGDFEAELISLSYNGVPIRINPGTKIRFRSAG